jgi:peptidoglycan/xylan/chitin deacetylase (PgdA/CDA1 family)
MSATDSSPPPSERRAHATSDATPGTVVFSVDAELGWGYHDVPSPPAERVEYARTGWIRLLSAFEEFDVPATWAVVGHLFLDACDGRHPEYPAPDGWFERERSQWADRPELRFADGLIGRIETSGPDHEIGCHGFSHVLFGDEATTHELAVAEVRRSETAAGRFFDSFVFPRNRVGHRAALAETDIRCYRGRSPSEPFDETLFRRVAKLGRGVVGSAPPLVAPTRDDHGLVNVPASMYLFDFEGPVQSILDATVGDPVVHRARRGIDAAAEFGGVLHLWLHPNNLVHEQHVRRVRAVLEHLAARRDAGDVVVETMRDVAARV